MLSRRNFIQGLGIAVAAPLLTKSAVASSLLPDVMTDQSKHRFLSCNIRVDLPEDKDLGNGWGSRKEMCIKIMKNYKSDIICLQEVLRNQNEDLKKAFPNFFSFGFEGPEMDGVVGYKGIAKNPIFFSKRRYELLSAGSFWLSETPLVGGSLSWGAARARHANWVRLRDKKSGKDFRVVNLHLDHKSQSAREEQIKVVINETGQYDATYPQILSGDFNIGMTNNVYKLLKDSKWKDTYTHLYGDAEPGYTAHNFQGDKYVNKNQTKIDFIFSSGEVKPFSSKIIMDHIDGRYPSDHYFLESVVHI